ncbi:MAG: hypothetical protein AB1791_00260 [Chloroflexota bacterium]
MQPTLQAPPTGTYDVACSNRLPLSSLLLADRLAELYEMVFSDHPEWLDEAVVDWTDEEDILAAVEKFLGRVNNLFPVYDEFWDLDLEVAEWRLYEIPVMPIGYDTWHEDWDSLREPARYLLHMGYARGEEDQPHQPDEFANLYPNHPVPRYLEPHRLLDALRQVAMPYPELAALPDLILMLDHDTGNTWLDMGEYDLAEGGCPLWSRENVEWLVEEWQKARPVLDRVVNLLDWKNESPAAIAEKLTAVREALLEAYERLPDDEPASALLPQTTA